jgi:hypothetical protein
MPVITVTDANGVEVLTAGIGVSVFLGVAVNTTVCEDTIATWVKAPVIIVGVVITVASTFGVDVGITV